MKFIFVKILSSPIIKNSLLQVVKYTVEQVGEQVHFAVAQVLVGLEAEFMDDRQHFLDGGLAFQGEKDVELAPVAGRAFAFGQPFLAKQVDDAGHSRGVLEGFARQLVLTQAIGFVQFLEEDPLVYSEVYSSMVKVVLTDLFHSFRSAFDNKARNCSSLVDDVGSGMHKANLFQR